MEIKVEPTYEPDWADPQTQAEIAAEVERDMADELEEESQDDYSGDRYGMLDFDGQFEFNSEDEREVQEAVKRGFGLGKWMDGLVDVFLKLEDEPDLEAQPAAESSMQVKSSAPEVSEDSIEPPPEESKGVWDDVRWFGRLVAKTVTS